MDHLVIRAAVASLYQQGLISYPEAGDHRWCDEDQGGHRIDATLWLSDVASALSTYVREHTVAGVSMQHHVATPRDQQDEGVASPPTPLKGGRVQRSLQRSPATLGERKYDLIRVEGNGERPEGHHARLYRNGELVPGCVTFVLDVDAKGVQYLTTRQIVALESHEDLVEEATQALEEREQVWGRDDDGDERVECPTCGQLAWKSRLP